MADVSKIKLGSTTYNVKDSSAITNITRSGTTFTATKRDGTTFTFTQQDNNTWRGVVNGLTSDSTDQSLSAAQGKALANGSARDNTKLPLAGGTLTGGITFNKVGSAINYTGTKETYSMIRFKDNTSDTYGNGIIIGGGGLVVIGGGESSDTVAAQHSSGGDEILDLCSDGVVNVYTNVQSGWDSRKSFTFGSDGTFNSPSTIKQNGTAVSLNGHTHNYAGSSSAGGAATSALTCTGNSATATTATNSNYLIPNTRMDYGWNGVNYFNLAAANQSKAKVNDTPSSSSVWWHIMRFNHGNNDGYYTDLAVPFNANSLYWKRIAGGTLQNSGTNGGWIQVLDRTNTTTTSIGSASGWSAGSAPSLSYTSRSIPNVTSVGTAPSLTYTARSIPNVTSVGSKTSVNVTVSNGVLSLPSTIISAVTVPTLGTAIAADDITAWSAGSVPTLGTAISADDITAWSAGSVPSLTITSVANVHKNA